MPSEIKAAIHSANDLFNKNEKNPNYGVLLVDANNAFNLINRKYLLYTIRHLWLGASRYIHNTYKRHILLFIYRSNYIIYSEEGMT